MTSNKNNTGRLGKEKDLAIPSGIKVFNSIQNYMYLQSNSYLSLCK